MGRRKIPEKLKKKSSDYYQLAFRVSKKDKIKLTTFTLSLLKRLNHLRAEDDPYVTKGDIMVKALYLGFEVLLKK